ncbi:ATP-dependent DNA helicase PIF1 [Escovopsis weberi]|uniref:ATP-dependent DNA helicase PIF1 n=1 Tax=Escovopsis weberi TaxID=150374 RepID=A0A0M9VTS8_ESCWE|nr:ATP-dependent DNA helicase PIF1 [Escovopsis weberi]
MLAKAKKNFEANPPPAGRNNLAKQPLLSSSPSAPAGDIREQFKKPPGSSSAVGDALEQARVVWSSRPAPAAAPAPARAASSDDGARSGPLASLYARSDARSFEAEREVIDLTGPDRPAKARWVTEDVALFEDDFSDDENLDLDFKAPIPLPAAPLPAEPRRDMKENMPPHKTMPPSSYVGTSQSQPSIPWSSSPISHLAPPRPQPPKAQPPAAAAAPPPAKTIPRPHEEVKATEEPANEHFEKKAKKRVLPPSFRSTDRVEEKKPATNHSVPPAKPKPWDASASTIQEQKRQFKTQRQLQPGASPEPEIPSREAPQTSTGASRKDVIHLSSEQEHVVDLVVEQRKSVFFTGPAGTGKSVLMRAIIKELREKHAKDPGRVAVTASTGLAACNIGGITLHSFSGIGLGKEDAGTLVKKIRRNPKARERWLRTQCLVIDEISMVDGDLFDKLSQIGRTIRNNGRPWGGIQLILTGDFFQLPPVPDHSQNREMKFSFEAATWGTSIDHTIGLTQVFRQRDPEFARMLNEIRLGKITQETVRAFQSLNRPLQFDDGVESAELFPTRAQVDGSNERRMKELPGKAWRYESLDSGDPAVRDKLLLNMMAPKSIELKLNSQVMLIKNLDEGLVNGSLGKVIGFSDEKSFEMSNGQPYDDDLSDAMAKARKKLNSYSYRADEGGSGDRKYPVVRFISASGSARVILCVPEEWKVELPNGEVQAKRTQLPLILAWALSIHKAQGQTLERVTVNLGRVFEKGQAYVALSRATTKQGLRVLGFDKTKVMAHPRVITFYQQLYSAEEASAKKPCSVGDFVANKRGVKAAPPPASKGGEDSDVDGEEALASLM